MAAPERFAADPDPTFYLMRTFYLFYFNGFNIRSYHRQLINPNKKHNPDSGGMYSMHVSRLWRGHSYIRIPLIEKPSDKGPSPLDSTHC